MIHNHIIYNSFLPWKFHLSRAQGSVLWDSEGRRYIDFTSGWNVANLGWNDARIGEAVADQLQINHYVPMWASDEAQAGFAAALTRTLPKELDVVGKATSGVEAVEQAMKLARSFTLRPKILGFLGSYHGENASTLAICHSREWMAAIPGCREDVVQLQYPDTYRTEGSEQELVDNFILSLETALRREDIAAVIAEPGIITGWGSMRIAPAGFLRTVRTLTKRYGTLLILDEIGTGFSRTGKLFGMEHEDVVPDILTLAKPISNGIAPLGATVIKRAIAEKAADCAFFQSTFGWLPVACAAATRTLELHLQGALWHRAAEKGRYMLRELKRELLNFPCVGDVRGIGLEIGIDFVVDRRTKEKNSELLKRVVDQCFAKGLHVVSDLESVIQIMPPLTIEEELLNEGIGILVDAVKTCS